MLGGLLSAFRLPSLDDFVWLLVSGSVSSPCLVLSHNCENDMHLLAGHAELTTVYRNHCHWCGW